MESYVSYLGIDCERFRPTGETKESFAMGLGSLHPSKGPDRAIEAISRIPEAVRPKLIWVGNVADPDYAKTIRKQAIEKGVFFELRVMVSDNELVSLLSRATCMLYTSRLEPFGLAPLEANACGTAVVAVAEGGIRETVIDGLNGFLVSDNDPDQISAKVRLLMESPELAVSLGEKAREYVLEKWNMDKAIDTLLDHFASCRV
jgi:glycosyltransferase involved in cell wall biosynthesis